MIDTRLPCRCQDSKGQSCRMCRTDDSPQPPLPDDLLAQSRECPSDCHGSKP